MNSNAVKQSQLFLARTGMYDVKKVQKSACTPCLTVTSIRAILGILICQLGDTSPPIVFDVMTRSEQNVMEMV